MKIAILNDTHCDYGKEYHKLNQKYFYEDLFFPYLLENNISHIIHLGDFFERKYNLFMKDLEFINNIFLKKLVEYNITMDIIPGNHDLPYDNSMEGCSLDLTIIGSNKNVRVHKKFTTLFNNILLVPWINASNSVEIEQEIARTDADVLMGHFELAGFPFSKNGIINEHGYELKKVHKKFKHILTGHYHTKSSKDNVTILGTQFHLNKSDFDDRKFFHILDTETLELTAIENKFHLYKKINYSPSNNYEDISEYRNTLTFIYVQQEHIDKKYNILLERLREITFNTDSILEKNLIFKEGKTLEEIVLKNKSEEEKMEEYVGLITTDLDKNILFNKLKTLLKECTNEV